MSKTSPYLIELNIYHKNIPMELNKFCSISLDTREVNITFEQKSNIVNNIYKKYDFQKNNELEDLLFDLIDTQVPPIPDNLLFISDIEKIDLDLILANDFKSLALGDNLIGFLNLDFSKFKDFFKFFCTFIFLYKDRIPKKYSKTIFKDFKMNVIYIGQDPPILIVDKSLLKQCAKELYKTEKEHLIKMQTLFKNFVDYIFNNNREKKLINLNNYQRFFIFQNTNKELKNFYEDYVCDYRLNFIFDDSCFRKNILDKITKEGISDPLSNEDFLIENILQNDPNGSKIIGTEYNFKTNNLFTYFYIVLYYTTLNNVSYIKKCQMCGKYFFSDKNNTLYCNGKYEDDITCKEYGIKTSQKRKETEEPVYGKYRQIYAKKAMAVKRNPDIEYYKTNYEEWKTQAKQFINDIKSGKKTYDEFGTWLDKNK